MIKITRIIHDTSKTSYVNDLFLILISGKIYQNIFQITKWKNRPLSKAV